MFIFLFICWLPYWFTCIGHFCCVYITYVPVCVSVCVCACLYICTIVSVESTVSIYICLSTCLSASLSICLSFYLEYVSICVRYLNSICYCWFATLPASYRTLQLRKPRANPYYPTQCQARLEIRLSDIGCQKKIWITHTYQRWFFDPHLLQVPEWLEGKKSNQITMGCLKGGFQGFPEVQIHTSASQQQT